MSEPNGCAAPCHHGDSYCINCDLLVGLDGLHVVGVERDDGGGLRVRVESAPQVMGCPRSGVGRLQPWQAAGASGRQPVFRPAGGAVVAETDLGMSGAVVPGWPANSGTAWKVWASIKPILQAAVDDESRFAGVTTLGVDEHIWHHVSPVKRGPKELTGMVDLTRDKQGRIRARLLDLVPGRSGTVDADWLKARGDTFRKRSRSPLWTRFVDSRTPSTTNCRMRPPCSTRSMS